ncbi:MAG: DpnD/PcfM family protein [Bacteroidetes bacterium]|uniref:DpnD/PcfM family protein n=1 Tax=Candidatus Gallipaludibacter merdavium TaxID=2840839 RepID=A0A9D9HUD1_9BACT|nr:DpnD/PcfM family protein [Candidatus Gallipaludibacter merdavium]
MRKYRIKVIETLSRVVEVEAEDYQAAYDKVEEMVDCEEVVLTADDFEDREYYPMEHYEE